MVNEPLETPPPYAIGRGHGTRFAVLASCLPTPVSPGDHGRRGRSIACGPGVRRRPGPRWLRVGKLAPSAVLDVVDDAEVSSPHPVPQVNGENGLPAEIVREETGVEIRVIDALD